MKKSLIKAGENFTAVGFAIAIVCGAVVTAPICKGPTNGTSGALGVATIAGLIVTAPVSIPLIFLGRVCDKLGR